MSDIYRLIEIKEEIKALTNEAMDIVKEMGYPLTISKANTFWYPKILKSLDNKHCYLGAGYTIQDTINAIKDEGWESKQQTHKGKTKQD